MEKTEYQRLFAIETKHWWYQSLHHLILNQLQSLRLPPRPRILDAGCGTGGLTGKLSGTEVVGLDISAVALKLARRQRLNLIQGSINALPFRPKHFDAILSISVLYHQRVNESQALAEIYRTLKPGGVLITVLPAFAWAYSRHDAAVHTRERYTLTQITRRLRRAGFRRIKGNYIFSFLFLLFIFKRFIEKIFPPQQTVSDLAFPSPPINYLLKQLCLLEWRLNLNLPFGSSIFITARKS